MWINRKEYEELKRDVSDLRAKIEKDLFIKKVKPSFKFGDEHEGMTVIGVEVESIGIADFDFDHIAYIDCYRYKYILSDGDTKSIEYSNLTRADTL